MPNIEEFKKKNGKQKEERQKRYKSKWVE